MIININTIYSLYTEKINIKLNKLQFNVNDTISKRDNIQILLKRNEEFINNYLNINLKELLLIDNIKQTKNIKYPNIPVYYKGKKANFIAIKMYIDSYVLLNQNIISCEKQIKNLKKNIIPFKIFKFIIQEGNNFLISKVIEENYELNINGHFGIIKVTKNSSNKKRVNWGVSNKNRAEIEKRGGIPYKKEDALKNPDYKGEKWLVLHPSEDLFLDWVRTYTARTFNPILGDFTFKPARGKSEKSIVNKLSKFKKNKEQVKRMYNIEL